MNTTQIYVLSGLILYFLVMIFIGWQQSRNQDHHGFVIGGRDVGLIPTLGSLAAGFRDGAGIIWWLGAAYSIGYGGLWLFVGVVVGFSIFTFIGPKVRALSKEREYITVGQMVQAQTGDITRKTVSAIILVFALLYMAMQLYVSGNIFSIVLGQPEWVGLTVVGTIVAFYLFAGGYGSVVKTDAIQFFLIFSLILVPFFLDLPMEEVKDFSSFMSMGWNDNIAFLLLGLFFPLATADTWQRVFSARNDRVIQTAFPLSGPFLIIMTLSLILLGYAAKQALPTDIDPSLVAFALFENNAFHPILLSFIGVVLVAITMSTLDTQTYLFTSTLLKDFIPDAVTNTRDKYIKTSKIIMVTALIVVGMIAIGITDLIKFLFDTASFLFILAPIFVLSATGWFKKNQALDKYLTATLMISAATYVYLFRTDAFDNMLNLYIPCAVSFVLALLGGLIFKNTKTTP